MRWVSIAALTASFLACTESAAFAQITQGRLTGIVADAQGGVVPGVTVTASSPALIGTQTSVTEADGRYRFPALPSGIYSLIFDLQGFKKLVRDNIQVVLGQTITVDVQLQLASVAETVTVKGESPMVDVTTTKVGADLKGEQLTNVPNSTDMWAVLAEAPGVRMQGFDVGGSHKSQQTDYEVFGIQNQSRIVTDGVDHTESVGYSLYYEDYFSNEEMAVSALGSDVEMNSGGAAVIATVKSGGNTFKGLYNIAYEPSGFVGDNSDAALTARGFTGNPNLLFWEGHADLGGPIEKDKVWFYGAYNHFHIDKVVSGIPRNITTDLGIFNNYTGKATYRANHHTLIGYAQRGRKEKPNRGISASVSPDSARAQDDVTWTYKGEWQNVLSNRAFLDVTVGNATDYFPLQVKVDPTLKPPTFALDTGKSTGAAWNSFLNTTDKPQAKAQLTYYLPEKAGSHDFKLGYEFMSHRMLNGIDGGSGPVQYRTLGGVPVRVRLVDVGAASDFQNGWSSGKNIDLHQSFYAQDRWSPTRRLTISAGVRADYQKVYYLESVRKPLITAGVFPAQTTVPGATLVSNLDVAPRLGAAYDLSGNGRTALKAFYGRYYNGFADSFSEANPGGANYAEYDFIDAHHDGLYHGPENLGALRFRLGGTNAVVNRNLRTPHVDEFSLSLEHQFWGESSARVTFVRKDSRDFVPFFYSPYVPAWVNNLTVPKTVTVTNPSGALEQYHVLDIPESVADQTTSVYDNIPNSDYHYNTLELAFGKRLTSRFFVQASADYQWRNELRSADIENWGSTSPLSTDPIGVLYFINVNPAVPNRQKTTTYHAKLMGRYTLPYDIGVGANLRYQSGFQYSRVVPDGGTNEGLTLSPSPFFVENLSNNRSDNVALLNLRLDKSFSVGKTKLMAMFDLYNVLNANPVTNFFVTNNNFGEIIAVLDPRTAQIGFRLEF